MLTENDIARISRRIVEAYAPLVVGTFGSYAVGSARDRSDLDLLVIKQTPEPPAARARVVQRLLFGVLHPLDVHVFTPEEFEETAYAEFSFTWYIARQARLYHWTEQARCLVPSLPPSSLSGSLFRPYEQVADPLLANTEFSDGRGTRESLIRSGNRGRAGRVTERGAELE